MDDGKRSLEINSQCSEIRKKCNSIRNSVTIYYTLFFASFSYILFHIYSILAHSIACLLALFLPNVSPNQQHIGIQFNIFMYIQFLINPKSESSSTQKKIMRENNMYMYNYYYMCDAMWGNMEKKHKNQTWKLVFAVFLIEWGVCARNLGTNSSFTLSLHSYVW